MALWQFTFRVVPKKVFLRSQGVIPSNVSHEQFLDLPTWEIREYEASLLELLNSFFLKDESQTGYRTSWGKPDETTLYFSYDENNMVDFTIRLDLRSVTKEIIEEVCSIGTILDAVIVTETGSVITLNKKRLVEEIKLSKAFKFISDPRGFFGDNKSSE